MLFPRVMKVDKNIHEPNKEGRTILHLLARVKKLHGDVSWLEAVLCDAGMDLNQTDNEGNTALHYAVGDNRKAELIRALIRLGADVNARDSHGNTPLHAAIRKGHAGADLVQLLLNAGADANVLNKFDDSPLHMALSRESQDCIKTLLPLTSEANINGHDSMGRTPLLIAVMNGDHDIVRLLFNAGADPNKSSSPEISDETPDDPLKVAISNYRADTAAILLQYGACPTESAYDALTGIYNSFEADTRDQKERSLLPVRRQLLELMLQHGLEPAQAIPASGNGNTLLHILCRHGAPIEDILVLLGHDKSGVNTKNANGDTPLATYISGAETLRIGVVSALLEHGADASISDGEEVSLLDLLNRRRGTRDVQARLRDILIDNGADELAQPQPPQPEQAPPAPETLPGGAAPAPFT